MHPCPNKHPSIPPAATRLAVIGEAPSKDDFLGIDPSGVIRPEPFIGTSGRFLRATLANFGLSNAQTFFGNVYQFLPPYANPDAIDFEGPEIQTSLEVLQQDLQTFRPNCILLLGKTAFRVARPDLCFPGKKGYYVPLSDWRGSIFNTSTFGGVKCVATYHPAYVLRSYNDAPFFKFDVARAVRHSAFPEFRPLIRTGNLRPTFQDVLGFISHIRENLTPVTFDIEGYPDPVGITMLSFVPTADPSQGIVIPFRLGGHYWSEEEEWQVWSALADLLADPLVPKTAHNCFYELFVFAWRHRMVINNLHNDTMMAHWELYPDFAKGDKEERAKVSSTQKKRSLGVCCSMYTEQPFYKDDRLSDNQDVKLNYSFLDSSVTAEVCAKTNSALAKVSASLEHYRFNISLIPAYNYLMLRGVRFDSAKAQSLADEVTKEINDLNRQINETLEQRGVFGDFPLSKADEKKRGVLGFNVKSSKQKQWLLYDHLKCKPLQKFRTESGGFTADEDALLHYFGKTRDPLLRLVIRTVRKRTRLSDIGKLLPDPDGRLRCSYDLVGTNSGRLSCRNSMSMVWDEEEEDWVNTGTNMQNQTEELRVCEIADEGCTLSQWDLAGADAWTVAAELAHLGYPAMLDDLLFGLKPSLILYHMITEHAAGRDPLNVNLLSRHELKTITTGIKKYLDSVKGKLDPVTGRPLDWLYLCCKRVQHGSNYDMQAERTAELVFSDSDGAIDLSPKDAERYQHLYKLRYKTDKRNDWIRKTLETTQCIVTSCGIRRQFFGIRDRRNIDDSIVREASAVNPQAVTTYITNSALRGLWYDPKNRKSNGGLFVEPLIQIHDALVVQNRTQHLPFCGEQMPKWFHRPIRVAGIEVTIPVEGKHGPTWGECVNKF